MRRMLVWAVALWPVVVGAAHAQTFAVRLWPLPPTFAEERSFLLAGRILLASSIRSAMRPIRALVVWLACLGAGACGGSPLRSADATLEAIRTEGERVPPLASDFRPALFTVISGSMEPMDEAALAVRFDSTRPGHPPAMLDPAEFLALLRDVIALERTDCAERIECLGTLGRAYHLLGSLGTNSFVADALERGSELGAQALRRAPHRAAGRQRWVVARLLGLGAPEESVLEALRRARDSASAVGEHDQAAELGALAVARVAEPSTDDLRRAAELSYIALELERGDSMAARAREAGAEAEPLAQQRVWARIARERVDAADVPGVITRARAFLALQRHGDARRVLVEAQRSAPRDARLRLARVRADIGLMSRRGAAIRCWREYYADFSRLEHVEPDFLEFGVLLWRSHLAERFEQASETEDDLERLASEGRRELETLLEPLAATRPARALALRSMMALHIVEDAPARVYFERARDALPSVLQALGRHPDDPLLWEVAYVLAYIANTREAATSVLELHPPEVGEARERIERARERARMTLALRWQDASLWRGPARDAATEALAAALPLYPRENPGAWSELAERFRRVLDEADERARTRASSNLGVALHRAGRTERARTLWREILGADETGVVALNLLATAPPAERDGRWHEQLYGMATRNRGLAVRCHAAALLSSSPHAPAEHARAAREQLARSLGDSGPVVCGLASFDDGWTFHIGFGESGPMVAYAIIPSAAWLFASPSPALE